MILTQTALHPRKKDFRHIYGDHLEHWLSLWGWFFFGGKELTSTQGEEARLPGVTTAILDETRGRQRSGVVPLGVPKLQNFGLAPKVMESLLHK